MDGEPLTEASFKVDDNDKFIRLTVADKYGRCAHAIAYWRDELAAE